MGLLAILLHVVPECKLGDDSRRRQRHECRCGCRRSRGDEVFRLRQVVQDDGLRRFRGRRRRCWRLLRVVRLWCDSRCSCSSSCSDGAQERTHETALRPFAAPVGLVRHSMRNTRRGRGGRGGRVGSTSAIEEVAQYESVRYTLVRGGVHGGEHAPKARKSDTTSRHH